ncbi:DUF1553 domain-containing protein [Pontiellaceae bacterium B12219]|nr:DUF1553 domain-containing protein [Pontiellaceae bacterium B12219]
MRRVRIVRWVSAVALVYIGAGFSTVCYAQTAESAQIDQLVLFRLNERGIPPSEICTDAVFIRRVYLDMIGTLPTKEEVTVFLADSNSGKRRQLIETLFDRPEFSDYWSMKWCDLLRVKAEFPSKLWPNAVQAYYRWIRTAIQQNLPYDQFARAMLTSSGSNFREAPVNFYRAMPQREPKAIASTVALTFMGMRTDRWDEDQLMGMAAFFGQVGYKETAEWKEEIVFFDPTRKLCCPDTEKEVVPRLPDGTGIALDPHTDPRIAFTDWLVGSRVFSNNMVNRIWYWLLGRGIIHEPDNIHADNPAQNPELLAYLSQELVKNNYDLRHIYRIILNSKTYQRSAIHNKGNLSDETNFSRYYIRRLDAEVLIDAICQITETTESYSSDIPEPFTFIPENQRSIKLSDGSITSPFLDLYGRPSRDTGYLAERNNTPSAAQKLHLLNSTHVQKKLNNNKALFGMTTQKVKGKKKPQTVWLKPDKAVEGMYLTILSRYPSDEELQVALDYIKDSGLSRYDASVDLVWALLNTDEFIFKH